MGHGLECNGLPTDSGAPGRPVSNMRQTPGKGGVSYFVTLRDLEQRREVEIRTNQTTYARLRVGDPVGFNFRKGSLGIYYNFSW